MGEFSPVAKLRGPQTIGSQVSPSDQTSVASKLGERYGEIAGALDAQHHRSFQYLNHRRYVAPLWFPAMGDESLYLGDYKSGFAKGYDAGYRSPDSTLSKYHGAWSYAAKGARQ
jgi:hypothetical protein